jgi:hypothetical protein
MPVDSIPGQFTSSLEIIHDFTLKPLSTSPQLSLDPFKRLTAFKNSSRNNRTDYAACSGLQVAFITVNNDKGFGL